MTTTTTARSPMSDVKDLSIAAEGRRRTEWAERSMPVLRDSCASGSRASGRWPASGRRPAST
jgi:hypothetical protein